MSLISVATLEFHGKQILVARYLSPPIFVCLPFLPGWDAYRADFGEQQYWKQRRKSFVRSVGIILAMAICGVCCSGALYAGILNTYEYVQREGCYGSYVSSRWGYLESDIVNVYIKISEFFGILPVV